MSKLHSEDLYFLIKSMSKSEKRYFKIFASKHVIEGENYYVKLFDAVDGQKDYDEAKLIRKGKYGKHFPSMKNNLYAVILKSLRAFQSESSVNIQLREYLHNAEILYEKHLFKQCRVMIEKAKIIAQQYEKHWALLELFNKEMEIIRDESYIGITEEKIAWIFQEVISFTEIIKIQNEFGYLTSRLFMQRKKYGTPRNKKALDFFEKIIRHPLFHSNKHKTSFLSKVYFNTNLCNYYEIKHDYQKAMFYAKQQIELLESVPYMIRDNIRPYSDAFRNLITCQILLGQYEQAFSSIQKFRQIPVKSVSMQNDLDLIIDNMELFLYTLKGDFRQGVETANSIIEKYEKANDKHKSKYMEFVLYNSISYYYFGLENYSAANTYLNKILNERLDTRSDIYCFLQLFSLIIHFETGDNELLEYRVKSVYRFLKKREHLYKAESILLIFIKSLHHINNHGQLTAAFKKLKNELEQAMKNPFEREILGYFDYISWLESKIEKRSFAEIIKEKAMSSFPSPDTEHQAQEP